MVAECLHARIVRAARETEILGGLFHRKSGYFECSELFAKRISGLGEFECHFLTFVCQFYFRHTYRRLGRTYLAPTLAEMENGHGERDTDTT